VRIVPALGLLLLCLPASCVNPSERIATQLEKYGFDAGQALCIGEHLEGNLSISQLKQLAAAARAAGADGSLTSGDLLRVASEIRDPKVAIEVARAGARCGVVSRAF
jgi:hypothetical protein